MRLNRIVRVNLFSSYPTYSRNHAIEPPWLFSYHMRYYYCLTEIRAPLQFYTHTQPSHSQLPPPKTISPTPFHTSRSTKYQHIIVTHDHHRRYYHHIISYHQFHWMCVCCMHFVVGLTGDFITKLSKIKI